MFARAHAAACMGAALVDLVTMILVKRLLRVILLLFLTIGVVASVTMMLRGIYFSDFLVTFLPEMRGKQHTILTLSGNDQLRIIVRSAPAGVQLLPAVRGNEDRWFELTRFPRAQTSGPGRNAIFGFELIGYSDPRSGFSGIGVPLWFVLLLFLLPLSFLLWRMQRARAAKRSPTLCRSCGYDLRAGHEKCPECGAESHVGIGASNVTDALTAPSGKR